MKLAVGATVLVQSADDWADTEYMFEVANAHKEIAGVVAWVPLDDARCADALLGRLAEQPRFCGIRNLIHDRDDPDWVLRPDVSEGLALLEDANVPFDFVAVLPRHLEHVPVLSQRFPRLRLVIDHLAKPPVGAPGIKEWSALIDRAASYPNVFAKVSGLYPLQGRAAPATKEELRPILDVALQAFGPARLMFGSDWPICETAGGYEAVVGTLVSLIGELDQDDRGQILSRTAVGVYNLKIPGRPTT
jgi:L-fuconolactonase